MKNRNVLLSLAIFIILMTGCTTYTNIVKGIEDDKILVQDVVTNRQRLVVFDNNEKHLYLLNYLNKGDTVLVKSRDYDNFLLHTRKNRSSVLFCVDSICSRQQCEQMQALLQKER